jgi:ABC-type hemin transport system ATPase subunit
MVDIETQIHTVRLARQIVEQLCRDIEEIDRLNLLASFDDLLIKLINDCDVDEESDT